MSKLWRRHMESDYCLLGSSSSNDKNRKKTKLLLLQTYMYKIVYIRDIT